MGIRNAERHNKLKSKIMKISTERLLEIRNEEIAKNGIGHYSDRRKTAEEILRGRGIKF